MSTFEIPFTAEPQTFVVSLAGVARRITIRWSDAESVWVLSLATPEGEEILSGVPLVAGVDLLGQHSHLNLGGSLYAQSLSNPNRNPGEEDLGSDGLVFFVTP